MFIIELQKGFKISIAIYLAMSYLSGEQYKNSIKDQKCYSSFLSQSKLKLELIVF